MNRSQLAAIAMKRAGTYDYAMQAYRTFLVKKDTRARSIFPGGFMPDPSGNIVLKPIIDYSRSAPSGIAGNTYDATITFKGKGVKKKASVRKKLVHHAAAARKRVTKRRTVPRRAAVVEDESDLIDEGTVRLPVDEYGKPKVPGFKVKETDNGYEATPKA